LEVLVTLSKLLKQIEESAVKLRSGPLTNILWFSRMVSLQNDGPLLITTKLLKLPNRVALMV